MRRTVAEARGVEIVAAREQETVDVLEHALDIVRAADRHEREGHAARLEDRVGVARRERELRFALRVEQPVDADARAVRIQHALDSSAQWLTMRTISG